MGCINIAQGQIIAILGCVKEHAIRIALPDAFVLPLLQKIAEMRRARGDQIIQRDRHRAARGIGNFTSMGLQARLQVLSDGHSRKPKPDKESQEMAQHGIPLVKKSDGRRINPAPVAKF